MIHLASDCLQAQFGTSILKNPYLAFRFKGGAPRDRITLNWVYNHGDQRNYDSTIA